jgi:hypothetical protein
LATSGAVGAFFDPAAAKIVPVSRRYPAERAHADTAKSIRRVPGWNTPRSGRQRVAPGSRIDGFSISLLIFAGCPGARLAAWAWHGTAEHGDHKVAGTVEYARDVRQNY